MQSAFDGIYEIEEKKITTAVAVAACTLYDYVDKTDTLLERLTKTRKLTTKEL